jgi:pilus assembly protein CpaC
MLAPSQTIATRTTAMTRLLAALTLGLSLVLAAFTWSAPAAAEQNRFVRLGLNKSMVIRLPAAARDVLVGNPSVVDAVVRTQNTAYLFAKGVGQTNIFFFDAAGRQILNLDIDVAIDGAALRQLLGRAVPGANITVDTMNDTVILAGTAPNAAAAQQAVDLASAFLGGASSGGSSGGATATAGGATASAGGSGGSSSKVVNNISITGKDQVMLRVRVVEMQREILKQFGINVGAALNSGALSVGFVNVNPFSLNEYLGGAAALPGSPVSSGLGMDWVSGNDRIESVLRAYERDSLLRTLAEPTLTAISGESAKFLAGGEFPIPVSQQDGEVTVEFKPFGVGLAFTPVVLSEGRISLRVNTEVSETTNTDAFTIGTPGTNAQLTIPALKVRRAETTMELPSGGSMVMAGLILDSTKQALNGFPGAKDLPVLGSLFRSRDFQSNETELVVIVTPYVVNPVNEAKLATPLDSFNVPTDRQTILWGRLNKVYGAQPRTPQGVYHGNVGFIVE